MQSGSLTAVTSVLFGGTERVFPQVKTPLGHSQIIVYCQSQQTAARDRRFQRVCGRWLSGGEGLCGGVWVSCSAWQRTTQQANIECAAAERGFVCWRVGVVFCLTAHNTAGKYRVCGRWARVCVVACGCRVLPDSAQHSRQISMPRWDRLPWTVRDGWRGH